MGKLTAEHFYCLSDWAATRTAGPTLIIDGLNDEFWRKQVSF